MWRREQKFLSDYRTTRPDMLCSLLEERVPSGLTETLHQAFFRAFSLLFEKGVYTVTMDLATGEQTWTWAELP